MDYGLLSCHVPRKELNKPWAWLPAVSGQFNDLSRSVILSFLKNSFLSLVVEEYHKLFFTRKTKCFYVDNFHLN